MSDEALCFEKVEVRQMYGDDHDGLSVGEMCPGINIIFGPNGAGKTTLARSLQRVLWPSELDDGESDLRACFRLDGSTWNLSINAGRVRCRCEGPVDRQLPSLPAADRHSRYRLHLHELLEASNRSFAAAIQKEAVGGFDIRGASERLGFKEVRPRRGQTTEAVERARRKLKEAEGSEKALRREQDRVAALERDLASAREAERRVQLLEQVLAYLEAQQALSENERALDDFPVAMSEVTGDEQTELQEWEDRKQAAKTDLEEARQQLSDANESIAENRIQEGLPEGFLGALQDRLQELKQAENEAGQTRRELERVLEEKEEEWKRIRNGIDPSKAASIDVDAVQELIASARQEEGVHAEKKALDELKRLLGEAEHRDQLGSVKEAVQHLRGWLEAAHNESSLENVRSARRWIIASAVLAAAAGVALGALVHPAGFAVIGIALLLGYVALQLGKGKQETGAREFHRQKFGDLGFGEPEAWSVQRVEQHEKDLLRQWDEMRLDALKADEVERLTGREKAVTERLEAVEANRRELAERLGAAPGASEEALAWLVDRLGRWQTALIKAEGLEKKLAAAASDVAGRLGTLNEELTSFGFEEAADSSEVAGYIEALREAESSLSEARTALRQAAKEEERAENELEESSTAIAELYGRLDLEEGDRVGLSRLIDKHGDFREAEEAVREARQREKFLREGLEERPGFEEPLLEAAPVKIEEELEQAREAAAKKDELLKQIHQIEQQVNDAKEKHDVEEKKAIYRHNLETLRRERRGDYETLAGWILAEHVHEKTRDQELPQVFHRARRLFKEITRHRYQLGFDSRDAGFWAYDNNLDRRLALNELSSGTRIQLLLAVRVAFVEELEQGFKLPLILDETLANSDDGRAEAIIEAILKISEKGRQVFYFTAQDDEVAKWKRLLDGRDGNFFQLLPLANASSSMVIKQEGLSSLKPVSSDLPDPDNHSHAAYGEELGVPSWDLRSPMGAVHLWYLTEDAETLHRALKAGFIRWGQLSNLTAEEARAALGLEEDAFLRIAARAEVLKAWKKAWLIGRGEPVSRTALRDSGAVSDTFIDEVHTLCEELDSDAEAIIESLKDGQVKRFYTSNIEKLESYFEENGYIEPISTLSDEVIRARVVQEVAPALEDEHITHDGIDRLIRRVQPDLSA